MADGDFTPCFSSLTSGDSGQLSGSKLSLAVATKLHLVEGSDAWTEPKTSDSGVGSHSPSPELGSDSEEGGAHKITVYVKYTGEGGAAGLVEGSVDSEGEEREEGVREVGGGEDYITICNTRVRLRLCAAPPPRSDGLLSLNIF